MRGGGQSSSQPSRARLACGAPRHDFHLRHPAQRRDEALDEEVGWQGHRVGESGGWGQGMSNDQDCSMRKRRFGSILTLWSSLPVYRSPSHTLSDHLSHWNALPADRGSVRGSSGGLAARHYPVLLLQPVRMATYPEADLRDRREQGWPKGCTLANTTDNNTYTADDVCDRNCDEGMSDGQGSFVYGDTTLGAPFLAAAAFIIVAIAVPEGAGGAGAAARGSENGCRGIQRHTAPTPGWPRSRGRPRRHPRATARTPKEDCTSASSVSKPAWEARWIGRRRWLAPKLGGPKARCAARSSHLTIRGGTSSTSDPKILEGDPILIEQQNDMATPPRARREHGQAPHKKASPRGLWRCTLAWILLADPMATRWHASERVNRGGHGNRWDMNASSLAGTQAESLWARGHGMTYDGHQLTERIWIATTRVTWRATQPACSTGQPAQLGEDGDGMDARAHASVMEDPWCDWLGGSYCPKRVSFSQGIVTEPTSSVGVGCARPAPMSSRSGARELEPREVVPSSEGRNPSADLLSIRTADGITRCRLAIPETRSVGCSSHTRGCSSHMVAFPSCPVQLQNYDAELINDPHAYIAELPDRDQRDPHGDDEDGRHCHHERGRTAPDAPQQRKGTKPDYGGTGCYNDARLGLRIDLQMRRDLWRDWPMGPYYPKRLCFSRGIATEPIVMMGVGVARPTMMSSRGGAYERLPRAGAPASGGWQYSAATPLLRTADGISRCWLAPPETVAFRRSSHATRRSPHIASRVIYRCCGKLTRGGSTWTRSRADLGSRGCLEAHYSHDRRGDFATTAGGWYVFHGGPPFPDPSPDMHAVELQEHARPRRARSSITYRNPGAAVCWQWKRRLGEADNPGPRSGPPRITNTNPARRKPPRGR